MSPSMRRQTQANLTLILQCMQDVTQKVVADRIGVADSVITTIKSDHLERFAALVAACGCKVVIATDRTISEAEDKAKDTLLISYMRRFQQSVEDKESAE